MLQILPMKIKTLPKKISIHSVNLACLNDGLESSDLPEGRSQISSVVELA